LGKFPSFLDLRVAFFFGLSISRTPREVQIPPTKSERSPKDLPPPFSGPWHGLAQRVLPPWYGKSFSGNFHPPSLSSSFFCTFHPPPLLLETTLILLLGVAFNFLDPKWFSRNYSIPRTWSFSIFTFFLSRRSSFRPVSHPASSFAPVDENNPPSELPAVFS